MNMIQTYPGDNHPGIWLNDQICYRKNDQILEGKEEKLVLTEQEARLLETLLDHQGEVLTRSELMITIWQTDLYITDGALTTGISRLKRKLARLDLQNCIETIKGQGYRLN